MSFLTRKIIKITPKLFAKSSLDELQIIANNLKMELNDRAIKAIKQQEFLKKMEEQIQKINQLKRE